MRLRTLGDRLSMLPTREEIERAVLDATYATFKPTVAQMLRRDAGRRALVISLQRGAQESINFPAPCDSDGVFPMVVQGHAVVAQDLHRSPVETHRHISRLGYRSLLVAPVLSASNCIGAIRILEREPRAFSEYERSLLAMIGVLTGLAMRNIASEA